MQIPPFHGNIAFNAHHAPMGAYLSFTCGHFATRAGLAAQLGNPAHQDLYIGIKEGNRYAKSRLKMLPFYQGAGAPTAYTADDLSRFYAWATDTWHTPDFDFCIYTPFGPIPELNGASPATMRAALLPAITAELTIDNRKGRTIKTGFFALNFNEGGARILDQGLPKGRVGFALRSHYGVAAELVEVKPDGTRLGSDESDNYPFLFMRGAPDEGLEDKSNPIHLLGACPGIGFEVLPGRTAILRLALGCYLDGIVTTRLEGRYLYTRYYTSLADVLNEALAYHRFVKVDCNTLNDRLLQSDLSRDQQFLIAHATRSYYANTQLLDIAGQPYWIVNEGEYCMMNTLDLAVDHVFWELHQNPWLVRNLLDNFIKHYSYHDQVKAPLPPAGLPPGAPQPPTAGGISFCHDQGVHNQFAPFGQSAYELKDLGGGAGCFSYMTHEQLCNWILIAASYVAETGDRAWALANHSTIAACLHSLCRRDTPAGAAAGSGIMRRDSAQCGAGQEVTTYDSLDPSLGQARNNLYLAVKCFAAYCGLELLFDRLGDSPLAGQCRRQLLQASAAIVHQLIPDKYLRAIFEPQHPAATARILAAIEGLIYPIQWDRAPARSDLAARLLRSPDTRDELLTRTNDLLAVLRTHTVTLLSDPQRRNHFPDGAGGGGIRLSSTSDNSWLSKIALVQHVARELFNLNEDGHDRKYRGDACGWEKADAAHVQWLTTGPSAFWAASDQFINGVAQGSRYYPRLITTTLWLRNL